MKKGIKLFLIAVLLIFNNLFAEANRLPMSQNEQHSKMRILLAVEKAAAVAATIKMEATTPNTGKDARYSYDESTVVYDTENQFATVFLTLTWTAKKTRFNDTRDTCVMKGQLFVTFTDKEYTSATAAYIPSFINDWLKVCLYNIPESTALKRIAFDPYK